MLMRLGDKRKNIVGGEPLWHSLNLNRTTIDNNVKKKTKTTEETRRPGKGQQQEGKPSDMNDVIMR